MLGAACGDSVARAMCTWKQRQHVVHVPMRRHSPLAPNLLTVQAAQKAQASTQVSRHYVGFLGSSSTRSPRQRWILRPASKTPHAVHPTSQPHRSAANPGTTPSAEYFLACLPKCCLPRPPTTTTPLDPDWPSKSLLPHRPAARPPYGGPAHGPAGAPVMIGETQVSPRRPPQSGIRPHVPANHGGTWPSA